MDSVARLIQAIGSLSAYEALSLAISVIGFGAVVASLFFYRQQTKEMVQQSKALADSVAGSVFADAANSMYFVDEIFIRHPEVRPYFYESQEIDVGQPHYQRAAAVGELLLDYFVTIHVQIRQFPSVYPVSMWEEYIADMFAHSPLLCQTLQGVTGWYAGELDTYLREGLRRRGTPPAPGNA